MKKLFLSLLTIVVFQLSSNAQFTQGSVSLGGSFNYTNQKSTNSSSSTISNSNLLLSPELSYMLSHNIAVGFTVGISNKTATEPSSSYGYNEYKSKTSIITPSLFIQTFYPIYKKLYWSLRTEVGYGWASNTTEYGSTKNEDKYNIVGVGISPELDYFLTSKVGLKANFNGFNFAHIYKGNNDYTNIFQFDINPSTWNFGFFVKL